MSDIAHIMVTLLELCVARGLMLIGFGYMQQGESDGSRAAQFYFANSLRWSWWRVRRLVTVVPASLSGALMFRLSQLIHNDQPSVDTKPISFSAMLTMATEAGKAVADIEGIGVLVEGNYTDVVLLSLPDVEDVPTGHSLANLLLKRGKSLHVRSVMVGGKMFIEDGRWQERSAAQLLDTLRVKGWRANASATAG